MMSRYLALALFVTPACGDDQTSDGASGEATGGSGTSWSANGSGGVGGASATSSAGSASGGSGQGTSGTGGGVPACVTDVVLLAEFGKNFECSFTLPPEYADSDINLVLGSQVLCWRASSQGCDVAGFPGGWWYSGDEVALCDSSCTTLIETEGASLYLWVGCPNDTCY